MQKNGNNPKIKNFLLKFLDDIDANNISRARELDQTLLQWAIKYEALYLLKPLIDRVNLKKTDHKGNTFLHSLANASFHDMHLAEVITREDLKIKNSLGETSLAKAFQKSPYRNKFIQSTLMQHPMMLEAPLDKFDNTWIHLAAIYGNAEMIKHLSFYTKLENRPNYLGSTPLDLAILNKNGEQVFEKLLVMFHGVKIMIH